MTLSIHRGGHPYWTVFLVSLSTRGKNSLQLQHHCIGRLIAVSIVPRRFFIHIRGLLLSSRPCLFSWNCGITDDDDGQRHACRRERERDQNVIATGVSINAFAAQQQQQLPNECNLSHPSTSIPLDGRTEKKSVLYGLLQIREQ